MKIGFIGLGKMGSRMVLKLLVEQREVVVWNRSEAPIQELKVKSQKSKVKSTIQNLKVAGTVEELVRSLEKPRIVWTMVTAGDATENILDEVSKYVEEDGIIIDGGNSYFKDTQRRYEELRTKNLRFLGIGVSGGIIAAEQGYPLMVGGDKSAYEYIKPILDSLSKPHGGHEYFGEGGAGHFVKMVHNGIEYGMMQSIGEGFGILEKSPYQLDLAKVASLWQKGTIVSGFLMDRTAEVLSDPSILDSIKGYIEESGEGGWTVEQGKKEGVPVEIIEKSLDFRRKSQGDSSVQNSFAAELIVLLRNAFGGHSIRRTQSKKVERK